MPTNEYSKNIVYLSKEQYQELIANETLTINGQTITYNENDIYVTPQEEPVTDIKINGTSAVQNGIANIPLASTNSPGVSGLKQWGGLKTDNGNLYVEVASDAHVKAGTSLYTPIVPGRQHAAAFYGLAKAAGDTTQAQSENVVGTYTDNAKAAIYDMLNAPVTVSGTTPTITAKSGISYVCGEVSTLTITLPASGIFDVRFTSGSTPTVLTASGVTWPEWFDSTNLEADTVYELNISDGYGVVATWAV